MTDLHTTPKKILGLLKKHHQLSVNELKAHLQISDMAVRKHVNKLAQDQYIQSSQSKQKMGRPVTRYRLSQRGENFFPKNYSGMTIEFLHDLKEMQGIETVQMLFRKREERLYQKYKLRIRDCKNLREKVAELQKIQAENGYMAEYEQLGEQEFALTEYNCPILKIADEYKQACHCELSLFKRVLDVQTIERTSCISDGDHCCKYKIKVD